VSFLPPSSTTKQQNRIRSTTATFLCHIPFVTPAIELVPSVPFLTYITASNSVDFSPCASQPEAAVFRFHHIVVVHRIDTNHIL
jgi:hypothetical protein